MLNIPERRKVYKRKNNCNSLVLDEELSSEWFSLEVLGETASVDGNSTTERLGAVRERATADAAEFAGDNETRAALYNMNTKPIRKEEEIR